jgi:hypothetical protein
MIVLLWDGESTNTGRLLKHFRDNGKNLLAGFIQPGWLTKPCEPRRSRSFAPWTWARHEHWEQRHKERNYG